MSGCNLSLGDEPRLFPCRIWWHDVRRPGRCAGRSLPQVLALQRQAGPWVNTWRLT